MIYLTRLNGTEFLLNAELIQSVEGTPDTVITLTNNVKLVVKEKPKMVLGKIIHYQQVVHNPNMELNLGE